MIWGTPIFGNTMKHPSSMIFQHRTLTVVWTACCRNSVTSRFRSFLMAGWNGMSLWGFFQSQWNCTHFRWGDRMRMLVIVLICTQAFWLAGLTQRRKKSLAKWVLMPFVSCVLIEQKPADCKQNDIQKMHVRFNVTDLGRVVLERYWNDVVFSWSRDLSIKKRKACKDLFGVPWGILYNFVWCFCWACNWYSCFTFHFIQSEMKWWKPEKSIFVTSSATFGRREKGAGLTRTVLMVDNRYAENTCVTAIPLFRSVFHCSQSWCLGSKKDGDVISFQFLSVKKYISIFFIKIHPKTTLFKHQQHMTNLHPPYKKKRIFR